MYNILTIIHIYISKIPSSLLLRLQPLSWSFPPSPSPKFFPLFVSNYRVVSDYLGPLSPMMLPLPSQMLPLPSRTLLPLPSQMLLPLPSGRGQAQFFQSNPRLPFPYLFQLLPHRFSPFCFPNHPRPAPAGGGRVHALCDVDAVDGVEEGGTGDADEDDDGDDVRDGKEGF